MSNRRKIMLCREGVYYLFVIVFVIVGAVLREVNLLIVLAGMMIGPLLFNWRLVSLTLRHVEVRRTLPDRICVGDPLRVQISVANPRPRLPCWALSVMDWIEREDEPRSRVPVEVAFPHVGVGATARTTYRAVLSQRGRYHFGPLILQTRFPLGLVRAERVFARRGTLLVGPTIGYMTRAWTLAIEADRTGSQQSQRRRGLVEGDYYGLREWRPGDSQRWIHWRTTAKLNKLAVLQFEQQRSRDAVLLLDLWQPHGADDEVRGHVELAISFVATAVIDLCRRGANRLILVVAGQELQFFETQHASQVFAHQVLDQLAVVRPGDGATLTEAFERLHPHLHAGSRLLVVSSRESQLEQLPHFSWEADLGRQTTLQRTMWIHSGSKQLTHWFRLE